MAKHILTTPIQASDREGIKAGDIIYLNGHITTCRDVAHRRLVEYGRELPVDVRNGAILHAGQSYVIVGMINLGNDFRRSYNIYAYGKI